MMRFLRCLLGDCDPVEPNVVEEQINETVALSRAALDETRQIRTATGDIRIATQATRVDVAEVRRILESGNVAVDTIFPRGDGT